MESYGETSFSIAQFSVGKARVRNVYAAPALYPRIMLSIGRTLSDVPAYEGSLGHPGLSNYALVDFSGELTINNNGLRFGGLDHAEHMRPIHSTAVGYETSVSVGCDLDERRLERYEAVRNGGRAQFVLMLWPTLLRERERLDVGAIRLEFTIPRDYWVEVLAGLRYGDYEIIEVPRLISDALAFRSIGSELSFARNKIDKGDYLAACGSCRTALEQAIQGVRQMHDNAELKTLFASKTDEKRGEWYTSIVSRAKDIASRAVHHPNESIDYSRHEAQFVLRTVENCIALLGQVFGIPGIGRP